MRHAFNPGFGLTILDLRLVSAVSFDVAAFSRYAPRFATTTFSTAPTAAPASAPPPTGLVTVIAIVAVLFVARIVDGRLCVEFFIVDRTSFGIAALRLRPR